MKEDNNPTRHPPRSNKTQKLSEVLDEVFDGPEWRKIKKRTISLKEHGIKV